MMYSCICKGVFSKMLFGERPLTLFAEPYRRRI